MRLLEILIWLVNQSIIIYNATCEGNRNKKKGNIML